MLNKVFIMGRIVQNLELRRTQSGMPVCNFTLAVERNFRDKATGERKVDFIDCTAWDKASEFICKYFSKGRMAVVEGTLQVRDWTDKDGNRRRGTDVLVSSIYFADTKKKDPLDAVKEAAGDAYQEEKDSLPY